MKEKFFAIISVLGILSNFIPVIIVLMKQQWKDKAFRYFSLYWLAGGIVNSADYIPGLTLRDLEIVHVCYNMLDIPFILSVIYIAIENVRIKKAILWSCPVYIAVELIAVAIGGVKYESLKFVLGGGIAMVLTIVLWTIASHFQALEQTKRQKALLFLFSAVLFEYGTFVVIYIFDYFVIGVASLDNFLIYYISSLIALAIGSAGFLLRGIARSPNAR